MFHVTHLELLRAASRFPEADMTDPAAAHLGEFMAEERRRRRARRAARWVAFVAWIAGRHPGGGGTPATRAQVADAPVDRLDSPEGALDMAAPKAPQAEPERPPAPPWAA